MALGRGEEGEWKKHQECCDISRDLSIRQLAIKTALRWGKSTFAKAATFVYLVGRFAFHSPSAVLVLYLPLLVGGVPLIFDLARKAVRLEFGSDLPAGFSIVTGVLLHGYSVASIVVLMLSGGSALETYATRHASALLGVWAKRMPKTAHLSKDHNMPDLSVDPIVAGDVLVVQPDRDGAPALTSIDGRAESLPPRSST